MEKEITHESNINGFDSYSINSSEKNFKRFCDKKGIIIFFLHQSPNNMKNKHIQIYKMRLSIKLFKFICLGKFYEPSINYHFNNKLFKYKLTRFIEK